MVRLRVAKVQEAIAQELNKIILREMKDPRVERVSVTGVELSDDMSYAKVYVGLYGSPEQQEAAWQALNKALGYLRTEIARRIRLRFAPTLTLLRDRSLEYSQHIEGLLREIKAQEEARPASQAQEGEDEA